MNIFMFTTIFHGYVIVVFRIKLHILAIQTLSHLAPTLLPTLHPYSSQPAAKLISSQTALYILDFSPCYLLLPFLFQPSSSVLPPRTLPCSPFCCKSSSLHITLHHPSLRAPVSLSTLHYCCENLVHVLCQKVNYMHRESHSPLHVTPHLISQSFLNPF